MGRPRRGHGGEHGGSGPGRALPGRRRPTVGDRRHAGDKGSNRGPRRTATLAGGRPRRSGGSESVAAFFDLDKTVIAKASMVAFRRPSTARGC